MQSESGVDMRGEMGIAVMRSLVDAAAANTLTKYESTVRAIHDNLEAQQIRSDTIKAVELAVGGVQEGRAFLLAHWGRVLQLLEDDHPLNPRISDARHAIEHLGGMQLHLTSRKRRRIDQDVGAFGENDHDSGAHDHDIAMMHRHNAAHYKEMFGDFVRNTANCLLQRVKDADHVVGKVDGNIWLQCDPSDLGMPACNSAIGEKLFLSGNDTHSLFSVQTPDGKTYQERTAGTPRTLNVEETLHMSACMVNLVMPACVAATRQSGVYHSAVDRVQKMMTHVRGFEAADKEASEFASAARVCAVDGLVKWDVMFVMPLENQHDPPDFTIDFDVANGWALGFSPSEQTDAAESAQAYLGVISATARTTPAAAVDEGARAGANNAT